MKLANPQWVSVSMQKLSLYFLLWVLGLSAGTMGLGPSSSWAIGLGGEAGPVKWTSPQSCPGVLARIGPGLSRRAHSDPKIYELIAHAQTPRRDFDPNTLVTQNPEFLLNEIMANAVVGRLLSAQGLSVLPTDVALPTRISQALTGIHQSIALKGSNPLVAHYESLATIRPDYFKSHHSTEEGNAPADLARRKFKSDMEHLREYLKALDSLLE